MARCRLPERTLSLWVKQVDEKQEKRKEQEDWKKQETEDTKRRRIETEVEAIK